MKLVIINGPNLNFLGIREPDIYGTQTLKDIEQKIQSYAEERGHTCSFLQSNSEGMLIDRIQKAHLDEADGIILNPAAYTHYSYAIHDAVKAVSVPTVEVHLSAIHARESFRKESVVAPACVGQISGFGATGYTLAIHALEEIRTRGE
ncbi:type II 3-dehydroquinate dehydratase [Marinilactibacillus psychrotolerans]|uniref:3-dehydroquinate dehydratase n=2 Tax=Marinilactibacillus psychrotolerans TaxID=191770 RepID=A0AAV3WU43_9LACT|nr:type II 3-dehydroquinate dehydratase [Marinilactibacillus psychrotolerans]GEL66420.1 3-dehydroquinate dehydratase [Marinilactibacillus psychrotolerans]GEQ35236.1 3-dehydroquinate dehydratase [Marinilactibacillus psychrotolerans]SDC56063.1 3-dehydroquinate dehydratase [Marinilactibacillus psychrotolerans]SJN24176.1 3-dehydroquinate dehydratase II [Marinilactibacillus psychrotolerans 42ea]